MRVAVDTHGCRLNQAESDAIAEQLRAAGHELVPRAELADLYLLNSCAITHEADADARAAVRRARRHNPAVEVIVTGCHANAEPEALAAMPEVTAVLGNLEKGRAELPRLIAQALDSARAERGDGGAFVSVSRLSRSVRRERPDAWSLPPATSVPRTRPLLKVQDGCDYQCSFCIVPSVRGRSRSLDVETLATQLRGLVDAGHPEVVLTGAHLGLWGRDLGQGERGLAALVAGLRAAVPEARLRLGSVDPHEVDDALVGWVARGVDGRGAGLVPHLHLPIQHGDDGVLRAMRRAHRVADLEQLVPKLRAADPHMAIGTDVIVGFPGEDDGAFERTHALFEALAIPFAHVFSWSPRSGTPAVDLPDRVPAPIAAARSKALRERVAVNWAGFVDGQLGTLRSAVVLRRRNRQGQLVALTDNYLRVVLDGPDSALGRRAWIELRGREDKLVRAALRD